MAKAKELKKDDYTIQINYSDHATAKKLMKFISKNGDEFEISAEDMISFLVNQVNMKTLEPTFVDTEAINIVSVHRQVRAVLNRDYKKGEEIRMDYVHPYPLEFAILEQMMGIASIEKDAKYLTLTNEKIDELKKKITPEMEEYSKKFYSSMKQLNLGRKPE